MGWIHCPESRATAGEMGMIMKRMIGLLMVVGVVGFGGDNGDSLTGPQGQTLEVKTEESDNGNTS